MAQNPFIYSLFLISFQTVLRFVVGFIVILSIYNIYSIQGNEMILLECYGVQNIRTDPIKKTEMSEYM